MSECMKGTCIPVRSEVTIAYPNLASRLGCSVDKANGWDMTTSVLGRKVVCNQPQMNHIVSSSLFQYPGRPRNLPKWWSRKVNIINAIGAKVSSCLIFIPYSRASNLLDQNSSRCLSSIVNWLIASNRHDSDPN